MWFQNKETILNKSKREQWVIYYNFLSYMLLQQKKELNDV